jgi:uncharacterized protein (DUF2384 family)
MSATALTLTGLQHAQIDTQPDAFRRRDMVLAASQRILSVADAMEAEEAADALRALAGLCKQVEADRKQIKAPVLELSKKIDALAADFIAAVAAEKDRLETALGTYQAAEQRRADAERRAAQEEADRLAREAARAQLQADRATNQAEQDRTQQAAAQAEAKAIEARVVAAEIAPVKPAGVAVRQPWKFEVTDVKALYAARPDLCLIEPNNAAIRAQIPHNQNIPGLRIWQEAKASIR